MKKLLLVGVALFLLQGCSITHENNEMEEEKLSQAELESVEREKFRQLINSDEYLYYYVSHSQNQVDLEKAGAEVSHGMVNMNTTSNGYGQLYSFNGEKSLILSDVVSKMADQLLYNFPNMYRNETIALTSIVDLNDHSMTNWLGQTISEQFIHELHIRQLRVIDFKVTGNIQLTNDGEFALTRDWKKLNKSIDVQRILTGTMSHNEEGVIFNIRIVNADSNIVESTSSAFVPHSMFVGGQYDYQNKRFYSRDSQRKNQNKAQVRLVN